MSRISEYRAELSALSAPLWPAYLLERSGLPGTRANIELGHAVADGGNQAIFDQLIATDDEYLVFCGVIGLGQLLVSEAGPQITQRLRAHAADNRWRIREAVAMALQRLGDADLPRMFQIAATGLATRRLGHRFQGQTDRFDAVPLVGWG